MVSLDEFRQKFKITLVSLIKKIQKLEKFKMTMSSLKCHLKSFENQSSAKKFQKFRKSAQLWLNNKSRSWTAVPFLNHVQNREGFADGQRTAADVNDLLFELDRRVFT